MWVLIATCRPAGAAASGEPSASPLLTGLSPAAPTAAAALRVLPGLSELPRDSFRGWSDVCYLDGLQGTEASRWPGI